METPAWLHWCLHSMNRNHMFGWNQPSLWGEEKKERAESGLEAGRRVRVEEDEWKRRREKKKKKKQWEWRGWPKERWPDANTLEISFLSRGSSWGHMAPVKQLPRKRNTNVQLDPNFYNHMYSVARSGHLEEALILGAAAFPFFRNHSSK